MFNKWVIVVCFCLLPFQRSTVLTWLVSRPLYIFNYCRSQKRFVYVGYIYQYLPLKRIHFKMLFILKQCCRLKTMTNSSYVKKNILKIKIHKNGTVLHSCKCLISGFTGDSWIRISLLHSICCAITCHEDFRKLHWTFVREWK